MAKYWCTKCQRCHERGKIYNDHLQYKEKETPYFCIMCEREHKRGNTYHNHRKHKVNVLKEDKDGNPSLIELPDGEVMHFISNLRKEKHRRRKPSFSFKDHLLPIGLDPNEDPNFRRFFTSMGYKPSHRIRKEDEFFSKFFKFRDQKHESFRKFVRQIIRSLKEEIRKMEEEGDDF